MKRFLVVGLGNFGSSVARSLYAQGHEVIAVDIREVAVDRIGPYVTRAVVCDGTDSETLAKSGAADADAAVLSTGDDLTASVLGLMALRDVGIDEVYVKVISHEHRRVMKRLGATETVFPERDAARDLASRLSSGNVLHFVEFAPGVALQEMAVPPQWEGRTLRDLALRQNHDLSVVAVHDVLTDETSLPPDPDAPLKDSDTLIVAGSAAALDKVTRPA